MLDMGAGQVCGVPPVPASAMPPPSPPLPSLPSLSPGANATAFYALDVQPKSAGCPPVGPCLGFDGSCGDLPEQFVTLAGCYVYGDPGAEEEHEFLDEYGTHMPQYLRPQSAQQFDAHVSHFPYSVCHAFPDDAFVTDQFFVGLSACAAQVELPQVSSRAPLAVSIAIALPVDLFLGRLFEARAAIRAGSARSFSPERSSMACRLQTKSRERLNVGLCGAVFGSYCWARRVTPTGTSRMIRASDQQRWQCLSCAPRTRRGTRCWHGGWRSHRCGRSCVSLRWATSSRPGRSYLTPCVILCFSCLAY